jgi:hypothetical protein
LQRLQHLQLGKRLPHHAVSGTAKHAVANGDTFRQADTAQLDHLADKIF